MECYGCTKTTMKLLRDSTSPKLILTNEHALVHYPMEYKCLRAT
jgi:hypothetical protein